MNKFRLLLNTMIWLGMAFSLQAAPQVPTNRPQDPPPPPAPVPPLAPVQEGLSNDELFLRAVEAGRTDEARGYLDRGVLISVTRVRDPNLSALHYAVINNHPGTAEMLIARGADLNAGSEAGQVTPLDLARRSGFGAIASILRRAAINAN